MKKHWDRVAWDKISIMKYSHLSWKKDKSEKTFFFQKCLIPAEAYGYLSFDLWVAQSETIMFFFSPEKFCWGGSDRRRKKDIYSKRGHLQEILHSPSLFLGGNEGIIMWNQEVGRQLHYVKSRNSLHPSTTRWFFVYFKIHVEPL